MLNATGDGGSRLAAVEWGDVGAELRFSGVRRVRCLPLPGPFLPCVDLFDWWTLRCGVWAVFLLALLGNGTVVFVLVFSRSRIDVPRFLVTNLAAADFFMGIYLGFLAVVDAGTLGEFRAHAISWQMSGGCRLAGFLGVLSSELSVYTLAVITLERNYAITHAMHLNKRLSLRHAAAVMAAGWAFSLAAATLPLLGVSDYRKFAICLPFETGSPAALGYVVTLLAINGLAFLVLLGCYLKMYCAIRGSQAWNSNDSRIAKRMALLVFTDFLCWSPIAFFALTAAFGAQLVSLEEAKVFTVFVLPLNSCCNPFLYAILTKQFKKDCALVCKAIEESRVTRGIGRCRHSSNFSNRQTPANTNSLAERSSRGQHGAACACRRLLPAAAAPGAGAPPTEAGGERLLRWLRACGRRAAAPAPPAPRQPPAPPARAGSVSSSVEFSSSRSDSWRTYGRPPPPPRRAASWLVARKTSQDSNLSSSRNDSSGSNATASTGTWRTSRSGGSARRQAARGRAAPGRAARGRAARGLGSRGSRRWWRTSRRCRRARCRRRACCTPSRPRRRRRRRRRRRTRAERLASLLHSSPLSRAYVEIGISVLSNRPLATVPATPVSHICAIEPRTLPPAVVISSVILAFIDRDSIPPLYICRYIYLSCEHFDQIARLSRHRHK
ncbi:unnamed protein product, partial [Brenthis ino]